MFLSSMMPVAYRAQPPRPLEPARESIRYRHYSLIKTEETYVYWTRFFVRRQGRPRVMRQPREMGMSEVLMERFVDRVYPLRVVNASSPQRGFDHIRTFTYDCSPAA